MHVTIPILKLLKTVEVQMEMQLDLVQLNHRKCGGKWEFLGSLDSAMGGVDLA